MNRTIALISVNVKFIYLIKRWIVLALFSNDLDGNCKDTPVGLLTGLTSGRELGGQHGTVPSKVEVIEPLIST